MQTFKNHEQMKEYVEQEKRRLEERKLKKKEIISNNLYIKWLENFTNKYPKFRDDDFLYGKNKLFDNDLENIDNLSLLYYGIKDYADANYIYPFIDSDFVFYYKIKYDNIGYDIGLIKGQSILFFCERDNNIDDTFIDFNDILLNKEQENTLYIKKRLIELSSIITYFYEQNVPFKAIQNTINNTLEIIEENNKNKVLKKAL